MMTRDLKASALVLKTNPVGENHRGISMLVRGEGLLRPLAYGAQGKRSTLRGTAVPYNRGIANLHYDGAKDRWRLTAFDPKDTHDGLRENLDRFYAGTTWAEILLKTHGAGGDSADLFDLAGEAFSLLSEIESRDIPRLKTAFLWKFLKIEGVQPSIHRCGRCGAALEGGKGASSPQFLPNGLLVGPECAEDRWPELPDGARRWLEKVSGDELATSVRIGLAVPAAAAAETWLLSIIQSLLGRPLKSL